MSGRLLLLCLGVSFSFTLPSCFAAQSVAGYGLGSASSPGSVGSPLPEVKEHAIDPAALAGTVATSPPSAQAAADSTPIASRTASDPDTQAGKRLKPVSGDFARVEALTDRILEKEIELFRIDSYFRVENGRDRGGKRVRMLVYKTFNYGATFMGMVVNVAYNFAFEHHPQLAPVPIQLLATTPRLYGKVVLVAGTLFEMMLQTRDHYSQAKRGYSVAATDRRVGWLDKEIEALIAQREQAVQASRNMTPTERQICELTGGLLRASLDLSEGEYSMLHARSQAKASENRLTNTLTLIKKNDGIFGSDVVRVVAAVTHNGKLNGPASISTGISGTMAVVNPIVEIAARKLVFKTAKHGITKRLAAPHLEDVRSAFAGDVAHLHQAATGLDATREPVLGSVASSHDEVFQRLGRVAADMQFLHESEEHKEHDNDMHSVGIHAISGGTKLARGWWLTWVGFHYIPRTIPATATRAAAIRQLNHAHGAHASLLTGVAGVPYVAGTAVRFLDICRTDAIELFKHKQLKAQRAVFGTILKARMNALDELDEEVQSTTQLASQG